MLTNNPKIVTDNLVACWDPVQSQFPPRGIALTWADYGGNQIRYNVIGVDGVYLKNTSASWVGNFPATTTEAGKWTVMFDYVGDSAGSGTTTLVLDNDGIHNNEYNCTVYPTTSLQSFTKTVNLTSTGFIQFFLRNNGATSGNITVTNFRFFRNDGASNANSMLFDVAGGTDGRGSGHNGQMKCGTFLDFDGTDDNIETTSDIVLGGNAASLGQFTVSCWIKPESGTLFILSNKSGGPVNLAIQTSAAYLRYYYYNSGWKSLDSASRINYTSTSGYAWTHVAVTRSWDNYVSFYLDGRLDQRQQAVGSVVNGPVNIVGGYWGSADFNGGMSDFKIFNVELNETQIREMYNDSAVAVPKGIEHSSMELWYPMSDGVSNIFYDGGGVAGSTINPGVGKNFNDDEFLKTQPGPGQSTTGYNNALLFKESDSIHVDWTNTQSLDDITLSAWICPTAHNSYNPIIRLGGAFFLLDSSGTNLRLVDGWATSPGNQSYTFNLNQWYHVAATRVRSGNQILYVNGSQIKSEGAQSSSISMGLVEIGRRSTNYFNGLINEVVVYDGALSATEIAKLAATDAAGRPMPPDAVTGVTGYNSVLGYYRNDGLVAWGDRSGHTGATTATVYGSNLSTVQLRQGYTGEKSISTGRDTQGFPLLFSNNGAVGFRGIPHVPYGTGNYISLGTCPTILEMAQTSQTTIVAWIRIESVSSENGIISAFSSTSASGWSLNSWMSVGSPYVAMLVSDGADSSGAWITQAGTPLPAITADGKFHQVAVTINRNTSTVFYFYQDGVKNPTARTYAGEAGATAWGSGRELVIGRGAIGWGDFSGQIGSVQIYKTILSDAQIVQNYKAMQSRFSVTGGVLT